MIVIGEPPHFEFLCDRGTVIGILKAMLGLSASIYTAIYVAFLDPDSVTFLLLLAILPSLLALCCVLFINKVPFIQTELHTKVLCWHSCSSIIVAFTLVQLSKQEYLQKAKASNYLQKTTKVCMLCGCMMS